MLSVKTDQENNSIMHTAEAIPHFILNGVFISEQLKVAMINNHPYSLGDKVGYFKVTSISTNRVQLQHDKQRIVLHYDG